MSDEIKKAVDKSNQKLEKLEKLIKLLAADVGGVKHDVGDLRRRADGHDRNLKKVLEQLSETDTALRSMAASQASMASAVSQAVTQMALAQSLERRVEKIEATLFPPKH